MAGTSTERSAERWSQCIAGRPPPAVPAGGQHLLGVLEGEGIGPEVIGAALRSLAALEAVVPARFEIRRGGTIGIAAERESGVPLTDEVARFCADVFAAGGAVLAGPGGGRFVYDLRRRFDLFCKIAPLSPHAELARACRIQPAHLRGVDCLLVRENVAGVYQGEWREDTVPGMGRVARQQFAYSERDVSRIVEVGARLAQRRRGRLAIVVKDHGIPAISRLWRDCAAELAARFGVTLDAINVDYAAYRLVQDARQLDVVVAPNLFGDVLSDLGGALLGSRALSYSGNFAAGPPAVYQTNHGAAHDIAGSDRANPVGQILALAMLLRESFGLTGAASLVESAIRRVWREGWRTDDIAEPGCKLAGTREMGERVADELARSGAEVAAS